MANPVTISGFQRGVAVSPYFGFGKMVGMDIFKKPGIIQPGVSLINDGKTYSGYATAEVISSNGTKFVGTSDGHLYKNGVILNANVGGLVHDLLIVQDCLLIFKNQTTIDLYANISTGGVYTSNWKTGLELSVYGWKKSFVGQDNIIYFGNETKLGTLTTFVAGVGTATATLNTSALSTGVPSGRVIQTLCELNRYVVISTSTQSGGYGNAKLYFMDRFMKDALGTSFYLSLGVEIPERQVTEMITSNNKLYFFGNDTGSFYTSNTSNYQVIAVLPNRLPGQTYNIYQTPNAVAITNNEILFGVSGSFNSAFDVVYGVYSLRDGKIICKNTISTGGYGQSSNILIGTISVTSNASYDVGWQDGSNVGIDTASTYIGSNYQCWFESPMFQIGTSLVPRNLETIQFNLGPNLVDNQKIRVSWRTAQNEAWSTPVVYAFSQYGTQGSMNGKFPTKPTTTIQLKVEFDTSQGNGNPSIYGNNIELESIILN